MSARKSHWEKMKRHSHIFLLVLISLIIIPMLSGWVGDVLKNYIKGECLSAAELWLFWGGIPGSLMLVALATWMGKNCCPHESLTKRQPSVNGQWLSHCYLLASI